VLYIHTGRQFRNRTTQYLKYMESSLRRRGGTYKLRSDDSEDYVEDGRTDRTPTVNVGELANDVEKVATDSFAVIETIASQSVPLAAQFALPFVIFVGIGFILVLLRIEIIQSAPYIASHARKFAVLANGVDKILSIALDSVKAVVFAVRFLMDAVLPHSAKPETPNWVWPKTNITVDDVIGFTDAVTTCSNITTNDAVIIITQYTGNSFMCPLLRAATPLRWINTTILPAFNWAAFNYTPGAQDIDTGLGNCRTPDDYRDALCAGLQLGHILLEIIIPVAIGTLVFVTLVAPITVLTLSTAKLTWTTSIDILHIVKV